MSEVNMAKNFEERWVTINGSPVLIGDDGEVKGGAGGALRGRPLNPKSKSESRRHLNLLRERLTSGGLKRGEKKLIERRIETLSKKILESGKAKEMANIKAKDFTIFRTGTWNGETFTENDLDTMAASFNPVEGVPLIIGHSSDYKGKTRIPAFGRILGGLKRVGNELIARGVEMNDKLAAWIREGFYNQRSIELTRDNKRVLAVGMLGAVPPAVKGLPANDEMLDEVALQFSEMKDAKVIEFAAIDLEKVQEAGTEDTMKNVDECLAICSKDIEMALTSDMDSEKRREECMSAMAMCMQDVSDEINQHTSFTDKIENMKPEDDEEDMEGMDKMMAKLKEWFGIKSITKPKESEVDAKKEQEYKDQIAAETAKVVELTAKVKEFSDKAEAEAEAKLKAEQEKKDAELKAADEALKSEIKVFCDTAIKENRMTPAMREKDEPIMFNLGKSGADTLKSFQEKYVVPVVPLGEVEGLNKPPAAPEGFTDKAKKYVEAHGKDKEFSDCPTLKDKIARAIYLEKMDRIKF